jgi:hypothetical protein
MSSPPPTSGRRASRRDCPRTPISFPLASTYSGPEGALGLLTRELLGFVASPFGEVAELQAFDGSAISSAARTVSFFGESGTLVIETSQDFDEIEDLLLGAGMTVEGDVLAAGTEREAPSYFPLVAEGNDGTVVLTDDAAVAEAADEGAPDVDGESSGLVGSSAGLLLESRGAGEPFVMVSDPSRGCIEGVIATQGAEPMSGAITLFGSIDPANVQVVEQFRAAYDVRGPASRPEQIDIRFEPRAPFEQDAIAYTELLDLGSAVKFSC